MRDLDEPIPLDKSRKHTAEVLVDEVRVSPTAASRLAEAVAKAVEISEGEVLVVERPGRESYFSLRLLCPDCEISLPELEPRHADPVRERVTQPLRSVSGMSRVGL